MEELKRELTTGKLFGFYKSLFTEKQREILSMYYECDCTLTEVAENLGILRQSVFDCVKRCSKKLVAFEKELGCMRTYDALSVALEAPENQLRGRIEEILRSV